MTSLAIYPREMTFCECSLTFFAAKKSSKLSYGGIIKENVEPSRPTSHMYPQNNNLVLI